MKTELLSAGDVAKLAAVQSQTVRGWARAGLLVPVATTPGGIRLFTREDVDRFLDRRARAVAPR
jgi:DNA-binding transcriptional MerR regulator